MMKIGFGLVFLFLTSSFSWSFDFEKKELEPCPSSPNCVSTQEDRKRKRMSPLEFSGDLNLAKEQLEKLLDTHSEANLVAKEGNYFHYQFKTKVGKFVDDVEFLFDEKTKQIHFRSASRKGWWDMRKNKRRMKKIRKEWLSIKNKKSN